ncbi:MAG: 30S ribosome-binding factor RbfA [Elusimicrobiales bacterium]|nr:30S ribosome-binding factor RbfA [Elusimicrobiales bacterium]
MNFKEDKLKSAFLQEINSILLKRQDLKEIALITVTDVEVIDDGRRIEIYYSFFGDFDEQKVEEINAYLEELIPQIKSIIRKRVKTRFVPNIQFKYDNTPVRASKIEEIFKKIELEKNNASENKGDIQTS